MKVITKEKVGHSFKTNNGATVKVLKDAKYKSGMYQCHIIHAEPYATWFEFAFYYESGRVCSKGEEYDFKEWINED